jgi:dihydrofolate reductase
MGRKTYYSIGHPLVNRLNIVLSRHPGNSNIPGALLWENNIDSALFFADVFSILNHKQELFVIGGGEVYTKFSNRFRKIYITEVLTGGPIRGDAYFTEVFDARKWKILAEEDRLASPTDQYGSSFRVYERRDMTVRRCNLSDFMTEATKKSEILRDVDSTHNVTTELKTEVQGYLDFNSDM